MNGERYWMSRITPVPGIDYGKLARIGLSTSYGHHKMLWRLFDLAQRESGGKADFLFRYEVKEGNPTFYVLSQAEPKDKDGIWCVERKPYQPDIRSRDRLTFKLRANPVIARKAEGKRISSHHDVVIDSQKQLLEELATLLGGVSAEGKKSEVRIRILGAWGSKEAENIEGRLTKVIKGNERFACMSLHNKSREELIDLSMKAFADKNLEDWLVARGQKSGFSLTRCEQTNKLNFKVLAYQFNSLRQKGETAGYSSVDLEGCLMVTEEDKFKSLLFHGIGKAKAFGCGLMLVRRI